MGEKNIETEVLPWVPEKVALGALCYMNDKNYWYGEYILKYGINYRGYKTNKRPINQKNKKLLFLLALTQYAQGKYDSSVRTAIKMYEANHKKLARNLVAQIAVKLDADIESIDQEIERLSYEGYVPKHSGEKRLTQKRSNLLF